MNSKNPKPFVISLRDAACSRLASVERFSLAPPCGHGACEISVALPVSYAKKKKQHYPLLIVPDAAGIFGSAVEMSRLMAQTREIAECIVVGVDMPLPEAKDRERFAQFLTSQILPWCRTGHRVAAGQVALFAHAGAYAEAGAPVDRVLACGKSDAVVPALVQGLRSWLASGHAYGNEIAPLGRPLVMRALTALSPALRLFTRAPAPADPANRYLLRSARLDRDFEVFAALPESAARNPARRYGALLVLDANIEFSTVAEAAARMAAAGEIEDLVVIGLGVPRAEGPLAFAFRRFEEFSPPVDGYRFDDELGRTFRSLFAMRGKDARRAIGRAPQLFGFIKDELLPRLAQQLPIDTGNLGLIGHSAGGTFVAFALCQDDSPFRRYVAVSPGMAISGWWLRRRLQAQRRVAGRATDVFLSLGGEEKSNRFNQVAGIPETSDFAATLRGWPGLSVEFQCFEGETHSSTYPRAVEAGLASVYGNGVAMAGNARTAT